jgi:hypothetical protein
MVLLYFRFIGEWYEKEPPHHAPTEEQVAQGSRNCFIVGGIYLGWTVFALGESMAIDQQDMINLFVGKAALIKCPMLCCTPMQAQHS